MQIYVLNRARETLATTSGIYDDKHTLTLDAGSSSYEFKISKSDEASQYMDSGNYIVLQDDDGKTWLLAILDYEETQYTKTVYAEDAGIELLNKACDIWKANGPHSFEYYFNIVTSGTPWKLGVNQLAGLERTLTYEGRDTGLGRLLSILKGFDDAECTFDVAVKMNAPSEFKVNVYKQVGSDRSDVQMVYSHELDDITKKESRSEFVTALCGVGGTITPPEGQEATEQENIDFADLEYSKDGLVTTKGDKFLRAVDANKRFNPGQTTYIEAFYEYDTQSASELLNRTITRLKTYSEPQYTYTADVKIIDSTLKIGDTVTIIDHDYNPALYLSARVAKLEKSYTDPAQNTIEFCNYQLLSSRLADKLARLQTIVNKLPSASQVGKLESNVSDLSKKQDELASQITSANGKNTNFYGKTEPATPKNGDLWYKKLENGEIEMYQYQDGVWQLLASTAKMTTVQTELAQAKADITQAKADAQNAYDEAVKATGTANGAKVQTTEALKQVKQANDSYTTLAKEVAGNKANADADYKRVSDSYTALSKEVADNKANADADYQKAQSGIAQAKTDAQTAYDEAIKATNTANGAKAQTDEALKQAKQANDSYTTLAKEVAGNKASTDADYQKAQAAIAQAQKDLSGMTGAVAEVKKGQGELSAKVAGKVDNTVYQTYVTQTNQALSEKLVASDLNGYAKTVDVTKSIDGVKTTVADNAGKISTVQTDINGVKTNVKNAQGDITSIKTDVSGVKTTVSSNTGKITQLTTDVNGVKSSVSSKVDKTVYQSYVAQTDKALSAKLTASDLNGYAKTADVKQTTDGLSASITKVQGNLAYQASELIGKKSFEDGNVGEWICNDYKTKAMISGITGYSAYGYHKCIYTPNNNDLYWGVDCKVNPGDKYYVELLVPNFYSAHGGRTITVMALFAYTKDGKINWQLGPSGQVATGNSGWIKGVITVPDGVTSVKPCISVRDNGANSIVYLTYASFVKLDDYTQSQITTLSGKITATSDRLSSVYTKSEVDGKLGTKVEQSVLTQTSNSLSASIAENSKALSSNTGKITQLTADVNGIKSSVSSKVDNTVYQTYVTQTNQALSEKLVASDLNGYAKTVDVTKSIDGVKTTVADNAGKISTVQTDINGVKSTVKSAQGDISALQTDAKSIKATVSDHTGKITQLVTDVNGVKTTVGNAQGDIATLQTDTKGIKATVSNNTGKISTMQTDINGVKTNVKNAQGDISSLQTDAKSIKATVASNAGKITQLTTDVSGVKSSVSSKVDKTTYQSYVAQTDKALSAKLTASDLQGYAKTADVKQTTDGLSASITKVQGDLSSLQIGGANLLDNTAGPWKQAGIGKDYADTVGFVLNKQPQSTTITVSFDCRASASKDFYCFFYGSDYNANGGVTSACNSQGWVNTSIAMDGMVPITPSTTWERVWIRYNLSKIPPAGTKRILIGRLYSNYATSDWLEIRNIKLESGGKATDWCKSDNDFQSQLTTLSGKITATSDRLSSVYTKSETDAKLNTKVEQSVLTQTSNSLSASIAKNSKILSSIGLTSDTAYINANKIALNGKVLMSNATINDAFIGNLSANKITTGTLNAANVNLINVNASNISTGTLNGIKITSTGKDPSGTSSTTNIQSGYIDTNVINCSNYILVGKADADPRKRWQTKQDSFGLWFTCPAKLNGHTGNAVSDWQTEMQGFIGSDGWNYKHVTVSGTGQSGIQLALTPLQEWGSPYGGDQWSIGNWVKTENSNKSGDIRDGALDPVMWYSYTGQGAAYADQLVIQKKTQFLGKANFQDGVRIGVTGADHGIRTAWVAWSDWGLNQKVPCIVQDKDNWGGIAFPANGRTVLFTHDYRVSTDALPRDGGVYNGWGS